MLPFLLKRVLFGLRIAPGLVKLPVPKAGERWGLDDGSPFEPEVTAYIQDVKSGWVKFSVGASSPRSMDVKDFACIYRFWHPARNSQHT